VIGGPAVPTYDPSGVGYILSDNNGDGNMYLYDAEGRICAVQTPAADGIVIKTGYVYDAEGRRVAKGTITSWSCDPSVNGLSAAVNETDYILDQSDHQVTEMASDANGSMAWSHTNVWADGQLVATYSAITDSSGQVDGALHFYLNDWLGTRRVQTDYAGVLEQTCSSLPFGDSLNCTQSAQFPTEHHFTGKERDTESGNDYFEARYYSSGTGRFLSPDWASDPTAVPYAKYESPQTLNLYNYMRNNPLAGVDADGHCFEDACVVEGAAAITFGLIATVEAINVYEHTPSAQRSFETFTSTAREIFKANVSAIGHSLGNIFSSSRPGTRGKPDHQQTAKEEAAKIGGQQEVRIPTPGGNKDTRVADAARVNPDTGKVEAVTQVIRPTPAGNVPQREQQAARDIQNSTGVTPTLVPVRPLDSSQSKPN
jgi:RHS repeat-associated protein